MATWTFDQDNFFKYTAANFTQIEAAPDRFPDFESASGSEYWYVGNSVVRRSNHWGTVAGCAWVLDYKKSHATSVGVCKFTGFISMFTKEGKAFDMALMCGYELPRITA